MNQKKNLSLFKVFMSDDVFSPLQDVLKSGYLTEGPQVEKFESELKNYIGNENLLTINSATSGLTLALRLLMDEDKDSEKLGSPFPRSHFSFLSKGQKIPLGLQRAFLRSKAKTYHHYSRGWS